MNERFAVLDLGSNTFHLLIVQRSQGGFIEVFRKRVYTKLGEGAKNCIQSKAFKKGINCLINFKEHMLAHNVRAYKAIGTAALRTASNGDDFLTKVKEKTGIDIELIDGQKEAGYIAAGVVQATGLIKGYQWIMDIGGGSVEFILLKDGISFWKESFKIGLGILHAQFHKSDPITDGELIAMDEFLHRQLGTVIQKAKEYDVHTLVGASGSFEVIQHIQKLPKWNQNSYRCHIIDFHRVKECILSLNENDRLKVDGLPIERVDLIVVALKLMDFVIRQCSIEQIIISDYAMKEGVIREHYNNF